MCTRAHTNTVHRVQSFHNLKECFFHSNTDSLLEAVLSVMQHGRSMGAQVSFQAGQELWHQGPGLPLVFVSQSRCFKPVNPGSLQLSLLPGSRGQNLSQELSARSLALQFPPSLSFPACFLWGPGLHPAPSLLAWTHALSPTQDKEAPTLSLCSQRPQPSTAGLN